MKLTPEQVKGRIKNIARQNNADARILMRHYMMERFLERIACSKYKDDFIIKGGVLITAMVGLALRSTMDLDTSIRNKNLSLEDAKRIIDEIKDIDLDDGVTFEIKKVTNIMDQMEYTGVRFTMVALMEALITPMNIDISTGDVVTPGAIEFPYKMLLTGRTVNLWSYNPETILAEKLQTILSRGIINTRMRDFYDVHTLLMIHSKDIDRDTLTQAFLTTCRKRGTENLKGKSLQIINKITADEHLHILWESYQRKFSYAADISYTDAIDSINELLSMIK